MSRPTPSWTADRVRRLAVLWRAGFSASQIALALGGVSRSAVLGKLYRLGLSDRDRPHKTRPSLAATNKPEARGPRAPTAASRRRLLRHPAEPGTMVAAPPPVEAGCATMLSIGRGDCRWPLGEPGSADFRFCGAPAARGAYCAAHAARAYRPPSRQPPPDHLLKLAGLA